MLAMILALTTPAAADDVANECASHDCSAPVERHGAIVADLGLTVIHLGYQHPIGQHLAVSLTAGVFGTYFLPWFDLGDDVIGLGGGLRGTWFARTTGRGFYVAPYVRAQRVSGKHDAMDGTGLGVSAGAFAGWAFGIGRKVDVQLGIGAQYIHQYIDTPAGTETSSTPFIALDIVVGYRL
jgi:hypothetical protein